MKEFSRLIGGGVVGAGVIALVLLMPVRGALRSAQAQTFPTVGDDVFYTSYYDVSTSIAKSAAGYGGPGSSGGAGDGTVRIVNPTSNDTIQSGTLCAMIYVFDDIEELQACCGCPVTPDGMRTYSVINDLTKNFGVNKGNLNAGVIDVTSARINFTPVPGIKPPNGINCTSGTAGCCDPTGGGLNNKSQGTGTHLRATSALRAWMTHAETEFGTVPNAGFINGVTVEEFAKAPLDDTHSDNLQDQCAFILGNGSGSGFCSCGAGESNTRPQASRSSKAQRG